MASLPYPSRRHPVFSHKGCSRQTLCCGEAVRTFAHNLRAEETIMRYDTVPADQGVQESIKTLEKLFPASEYGNKGLAGSYGQAGRFAFAGPISWRERARRDPGPREAPP